MVISDYFHNLLTMNLLNLSYLKWGVYYLMEMYRLAVSNMDQQGHSGNALTIGSGTFPFQKGKEGKKEKEEREEKIFYLKTCTSPIQQQIIKWSFYIGSKCALVLLTTWRGHRNWRTAYVRLACGQCRTLAGESGLYTKVVKHRPVYKRWLNIGLYTKGG